MVRRVERDGQEYRTLSGDFQVMWSPEDSNALGLRGKDFCRGLPAPGGWANRRVPTEAEFTDNAFWSCGAPKYKLIKAIEEKVAEELMA